MPTIYIAKGERRCCNCQSFKFYESQKPKDALFALPPNIGHCEIINKSVQATRKSCKMFSAKQKQKIDQAARVGV